MTREQHCHFFTQRLNFPVIQVQSALLLRLRHTQCPIVSQNRPLPATALLRSGCNCRRDRVTCEARKDQRRYPLAAPFVIHSLAGAT
jgi:hypothetical protein